MIAHSILKTFKSVAQGGTLCSKNCIMITADWRVSWKVSVIFFFLLWSGTKQTCSDQNILRCSDAFLTDGNWSKTHVSKLQERFFLATLHITSLYQLTKMSKLKKNKTQGSKPSTVECVKWQKSFHITSKTNCSCSKGNSEP